MIERMCEIESYRDQSKKKKQHHRSIENHFGQVVHCGID